MATATGVSQVNPHQSLRIGCHFSPIESIPKDIRTTEKLINSDTNLCLFSVTKKNVDIKPIVDRNQAAYPFDFLCTGDTLNSRGEGY